MAISSASKLREILEDERACALIEKYKPGFMAQSDQFGPCMGMKIGMLLKFPQVGIPKESVAALIKELDDLDK